MQELGSLQAHGLPRTRGTRQIRAEGSHFNQQVLLPAERLIYNETISGVAARLSYRRVSAGQLAVEPVV
jgi:hypothetical protein